MAHRHPFGEISRERETKRGRASAGARGAARTCARSQVFCSCGARGLHAGARPCTEGGGRPAGTVGFLRVRADSNQRGGARAGRKRVCYASSRERASARAWRSADLRALASLRIPDGHHMCPCRWLLLVLRCSVRCVLWLFVRCAFLARCLPTYRRFQSVCGCFDC